jgi:hypothetical protein
MTPQEKAISLVKSMSISDDTYLNRNRYAKQCALIAVDEISEHCYQVMKPFWMEVKKEIEKL